MLDLNTGQILFTMQNDALDIYEKTVLMETPDGGVALSNKSRCAIWNTETGERIFAMRPFSAGFFDQADLFYGNFPKYRGQAHLQAVIDPVHRKSSTMFYPLADNAKQTGDVLLEFKGVDSGLARSEANDFEAGT